MCWSWTRRSTEVVHLLQESSFFSKFSKNFLKYPASEICTLWNSSFRLPKGLTSAAGWVWRFVSSHLFTGVWGLSIAVLPLLRIHRLAFVGGPRNLFPVAGWDTMLVQTLILRAVWISYLLRRHIPETHEAQIHMLRLRHCRSLFQVDFLNSLWHGALLPDQNRKKFS